VLRLNLFVLSNAAEAGACEYNIFFTVEQILRLRDVVLIDSSASFAQQVPVDQLGGDSSQYQRSQIVGFRQVMVFENGALISQALSACVALGKLMRQSHVELGLFHGRIRQTKPLLHETNAKHCGNRERWRVRFACRRKWLAQASQLRPRKNKIHFVKKLKLTHFLGDQLKSGCGSGGLFYQITIKSVITIIFSNAS
jgi:hypothetical protein